MANPKRATSIEELHLVLSQLFTQEGRAAGDAFAAQPEDIIISPYSKCGTTWLQQTAHGLRTRGDMNFGEITEVVPWIDAAFDLDMDLNAEQVAAPRLFKSHAAFEQLPANCRYICILRDPIDALISLYNFFDNWMMEPGCIGIEAFAERHYLARKPPHDFWHHLCSWYEQRNNAAVLLLTYEQFKSDFPAQLERLARFMGIELDTALRDIVTEQSSFAFMQANDHHFDDHFLRHKREAAGALPVGGSTSKVNRGDSRETRDNLPASIADAMNARWDDYVTPRTGKDSYQALAASLN